jgi:hypothetical protein
MYPHERSFVKKVRDKPVVLLGVNSDKDRDDLKKVLAKEQITWRSWWDGGGTKGPIASKWKVNGWPTIYVIDPEGIIRAKDDKGEFVGKPELLDEAVELVLAGAKPDAGTRTASKSKKKEPIDSDKKQSAATTTARKPAQEKSIEDKDQTEQRAASKFKLIEQLAESGKIEKAKERCKELIKNYPDTPAAADAKRLLEKIEK